eukprot:4440888-Amphidinium_carterae.1
MWASVSLRAPNHGPHKASTQLAMSDLVIYLQAPVLHSSPHVNTCFDYMEWLRLDRLVALALAAQNRRFASIMRSESCGLLRGLRTPYRCARFLQETL